jgi:hypothetical protein
VKIARRVLTGLLLAFVVFSLVWMVVKEVRGGGASSPTGGGANGKRSPETVVYYFHATARCRTCNLIEKLTRRTLNARFAADLAAGRIEMRTLNREKPEGQKLAASLELASNAVVLFDGRAGRPGRWKNLKQIWTKVRDDAAFKSYVAAEIEAFRSGGKP